MKPINDEASEVRADKNMPLPEKEKKLYELDQKRITARKDVLRDLQGLGVSP